MQACYPSDRAEEYRKKARLCVAKSNQMASEEARAVFADLAFHWARLAEQTEQADAWPVTEMAEATIVIVRSRRR
jgi:hypothetical protein